MNRICFALGTWQLILLSAALQGSSEGVIPTLAPKDHLILYGPDSSDDLRIAMHSVAEQVWDWQSINWAGDLLDRTIPDSYNEFIERKSLLAKRVTKLNPDEVWLSKLSDIPEKMAAETFKDSAIVLYEDGLHTYVPVKIIESQRRGSYYRFGNFLTSLRKLASDYDVVWKSLNRGGIHISHLRRLREIHTFLDKNLQMPNMFEDIRKSQISTTTLLAMIQRCFDLVPVDNLHVMTRALSQQSVLVLGQCFARWKLMSREDEHLIYRNQVGFLLENGFDVLWKEHPRIDTPFFAELSEYFSGRITELPLAHYLPVELLVGQIPLSNCVGGTSTSLFYLAHLFGVNTYTFSNSLVSLIDGDFGYMKQLVSRNIPDILEIRSQYVQGS